MYYELTLRPRNLCHRPDLLRLQSALDALCDASNSTQQLMLLALVCERMSISPYAISFNLPCYRPRMPIEYHHGSFLLSNGCDPFSPEEIAELVHEILPPDLVEEVVIDGKKWWELQPRRSERRSPS